MILHSDITGQGEPLVFIHGLFGSYDNLGVIARSLQSQFKIINLDVRNHGRSPHAAGMAYSELAADVAETLDQLGFAQTAVLGHSMGGKIAMQLALNAPERVSKLILADISPVLNQARHSHILQGLTAVSAANIQQRNQADAILAQYISEIGVRQFLLKSLYKADDSWQWRFNLPVLSAEYPAILQAPVASGHYPGPTLFIKGGNSDYILPSHQSDILRLFPQATAKIIQGTGHWLHAEKPTAFSKIVQDFLLR
jgi:esterase